MVRVDSCEVAKQTNKCQLESVAWTSGSSFHL
jgi:hypothetical protein